MWGGDAVSKRHPFCSLPRSGYVHLAFQNVAKEVDVSRCNCPCHAFSSSYPVIPGGYQKLLLTCLTGFFLHIKQCLLTSGTPTCAPRVLPYM